MILVDKALAQREQAGNPIKVAIVGAGYSGRNISYHSIKSFPAMRVVAISNRTLESARSAYSNAGINEVATVQTSEQLEDCIRSGRPAITEDANVTCDAEG